MKEQYFLLIDQEVAKSLKDFAPKQYKQIMTKIVSLAANPTPQDCVKLQGHTDGYRVDQGEYRILYYLVAPLEDRPGEVQIFRVGKRNDDEVYQNL